MPTDFQNLILEKLHATPKEKMSEEERAVMSVLMPTFQGQPKVTQNDIARAERWLGCHPLHEADIRANKLETTTRQVRQIINDLRNKYLIPILSDANGYWICRSQEEASQYLERLAGLAKSSAQAYFQTYKSMRESLNVKQIFFESLELIS